MVAADSLRHPAPDVLRDFALGRLSPLEMAEVERHIETCDSCCAALAQIPDDTLLDRIRPDQTAHAVTRIVPGGFASDAASEFNTLANSVADGESHSVDHARSVEVSSAIGRSVSDGAPGSDNAERRMKSADAAPRVPRELLDHPRYRIVKALGVGGMGVVYEAEHRLMERAVALKVINSRLVRHPLAVERFRQEVRAAARLSHPNIVTAFDAEQAGELHFLVMEYVEGESLDRLVARRGPLPVVHACNYIRQVALGLQHASSLGMVHRDIKPHNLMLAKGGRVKILDFGLARLARELDEQLDEHLNEQPDEPSGHEAGTRSRRPLASTLTADGAVLGTPDYMAPEQAGDARRADIRADIYSLGCTFYFLLTGQPPFAEGSVVEKLVAHQTRRPRDVRELRPEVSEEVAQILARMLEKSPADRWQTPEELVKRLTPLSSMNASVASGASSATAGPATIGSTTPDSTPPDSTTRLDTTDHDGPRAGRASAAEPLVELQPVVEPHGATSLGPVAVGASPFEQGLANWTSSQSWPTAPAPEVGPAERIAASLRSTWRTHGRWLGPVLVASASIVVLAIGGWALWGGLASVLDADKGAGKQEVAKEGDDGGRTENYVASAGRDEPLRPRGSRPAWSSAGPSSNSLYSNSPSSTGQASTGQPSTGSSAGRAPGAASSRNLKRWLIVVPHKQFWYQDYALLVTAIEATGGGEVEVASSTLEPPIPAKDDRLPAGSQRTVRPDVVLREADASRYDVAIFIGAVPSDANEFLGDRPNGGAVKMLLKDMLLAGKPVAGLCSGIAVLADAGVLRGEPAAKNPYLPQRMLVGSGALWDDQAAVHVTSRGAWTARDEAAAKELVVRLRRSASGKL